MPSRPIRWIHLSDLHFGCAGAALRPQLERAFERSVKKLADLQGPPDLVLLTGDLAYSGQPAEYEQLDVFLAKLRGWFATEQNPGPLILPVPGNHDLARPRASELRVYRVLEDYERGDGDEDVRQLRRELWQERALDFVRSRFTAYEAWFERSIAPDLAKRAALHRSPFPGDYSARIELPGTFPLLVVGLNSSWMQVRGDRKPDEFQGQLWIELEQFHWALAEPGTADPLRAFDARPEALLLQHHPPQWLHRRARDLFYEQIYVPERFALCTFGHLHQSRVSTIGEAGGPPRHYFQAPSLFSLESYGDAAREQRSFGWCWGQIAADGEVRVWPRTYVKSGGAGRFAVDLSFHEHEDQTGLQIRPPRQSALTSKQRGRKKASNTKRGSKEPPSPARHPAPLREEFADALARYVEWAKTKVQFLDMRRLGADDVQLPFDEVYVSLECRRRGSEEDGLYRTERERHDDQSMFARNQDADMTSRPLGLTRLAREDNVQLTDGPAIYSKTRERKTKSASQSKGCPLIRQWNATLKRRAGFSLVILQNRHLDTCASNHLS